MVNTKVRISDAINEGNLDHNAAERLKVQYRKEYEKLDKFCDGFMVKKNKKLAIESRNWI